MEKKKQRQNKIKIEICPFLSQGKYCDIKNNGKTCEYKKDKNKCPKYKNYKQNGGKL